MGVLVLVLLLSDGIAIPEARIGFEHEPQKRKEWRHFPLYQFDRRVRAVGLGA
jgi:hypothetical protein